MTGRPAAGGGRWVDVPPERFERWLDGFAARHGAAEVSADGGVLRLAAADGATAECWPPPGAPEGGDRAEFVAAALAPRRIGLLLARRAAVAVGVADGPRLVESKVDTHYVQSRTAAGGWSQQRFARRRVNQAKAAAGDSADIAARILVPAAPTLAAVVGGGDRRTVEMILADRRLTAAAELLADRFLDVPDPRLVVLESSVAAARAVRIRIVEP